MEKQFEWTDELVKKFAAHYCKEEKAHPHLTMNDIFNEWTSYYGYRRELDRKMFFGESPTEDVKQPEPKKELMNKVYILQKDLPDYKTGERFTFDGTFYESEHRDELNTTGKWSPRYVENNPEWFLEEQESPKREPLFVTEDGVEIFDDRLLLCYVNSAWYLGSAHWNDRNNDEDKYRKWFFTKEAAEQYIRENKPSISEKEIKKRELHLIGSCMQLFMNFYTDLKDPLRTVADDQLRLKYLSQFEPLLKSKPKP